jgi:phosphoglycolate phosphatase-like HAD superfamily hydrolase
MTFSSERGLTVPIIRGIKYLLLDFDGPICHAFAGFPAPEVAATLRERLYARGVAPKDWMTDVDDPHEILRASLALGLNVPAQAEKELARLEIRAVRSATPTPHASEVIERAKADGGKVAIVSNNAESAVSAYLLSHGLTGQIDHIAARVSPDPALMKPNPYLVNQAIDALHADRAKSALVGDQVSDVIAAHRADLAGIGFANKERKFERFRQAKAELIIESMAQLILAGHQPAAIDGL